MSKKITILIIASIIGVIALSLIQGYLVKNTYTLKKEVFIEKAGNELDDLDNYGSAMDSINDLWGDTFIEELDKYGLRKIEKRALIQRLRIITDSLNPDFLKIYDTALKKKKLAYKLKYHKTLTKVIVTNGTKIDTVFKADNLKPFTLFGYAFKDDPDLHVGNTIWQTERSVKKEDNGQTKQISYHLYVESENYINIDDWTKLIFNQMRGLLGLSIFIFLAVISLLYYSIKNLITQKKVADVKTDFINNITHEFKTPLATLTLATKMLKNQKTTVKNLGVGNAIQTIDRQNIRLQKLIDQVLDNSLGYKEIQLKKEVTSLQDYLDFLLQDFKIRLKETDVLLKYKQSDKDVIIEIDKFYFTTAILNMLDNAIKYGGTRVEVLSFIKEREGTVEIKIIDNGKGIAKDQIKDIFEKFYRVENTNVHNVKGLGLGLYYSNQIIKAHNGTITVESEKGVGTSFSIKIPL